MGCWCETDGVTQLPINAGNKVRLFVLERQVFSTGDTRDNGRGTCYNTEIWRPIGGAIQGKYDDYGCIEKIVENETTEAILKEIKKGIVPCVEDRKAEVLNLSVHPDELQAASLQETLSNIERGYVKFKNRLGIEVELGLFMVLEDVYKAFIKYDPIIAHVYAYGPGGNFEYMPYSKSLNIQFEQWYSKLLENSKERARLELELVGEPAEVIQLKMQLQDLMVDLMTLTLDQRIFDTMYGVNLKSLEIKLVALAKEQVPFNDEKVQTLISSVKESISFNSSMTEARKQWAPQTGKGSQSNELEIYTLLNTVTNKIIAKREKEMIEYGCEKPNKQGYTSYMLEHNASLKASAGKKDGIHK